MKTWQEIFSEFKEEKKDDWKSKHKKEFYAGVEIFIKYVSQMNYTFQDISAKMMERHKRWLIGLKDIHGQYYTITWYFLYFKKISVLLHWLVEKGYIAIPDFFPMKMFEIRAEMAAILEQRRIAFFREREQNIEEFKDSHILRVYGNYIKNYSFNDRLRLRMLWTLGYISEYARERNKTMLTIEKEDREGILNALYLVERLPGYQVGETCYILYFSAVRHFYHWAFDHGYTREKSFLCDISDNELIEYFQTRKLHAPHKSRYYTTEEILKAHEKFLTSSYKNFNEVSNLSNAVREFLRYITARDRTFYTVDEPFIEEWKKYLFNYEHRPGVYYTANYIAEKIKRIKNFYSWFQKRGYREDHPLKNFEKIKYRESIRKICESRKQAIISYPEVPECFQKLFNGASEFEKTLNKCESTLKQHQRAWKFFFLYLEKLDIKDIRKVDEPVLNDYQIYLNNFKKEREETLSLNTRCRFLISLKVLFYYLARFRYLDRDPSMAISLPKNPGGLPTPGMNTKEVQKLVEMPDGDDCLSIRDRAILETLYSTGVRRNELHMLKVRDIDFQAGMVRINYPKGGANFQRVVPIGKTACECVLRYLKESRPVLLKGNKNNDWLFLNQYGGHLAGERVLNIVKTYVIKAGLKMDEIVTHSFRVTCATGMLKGKGKYLKGADIKWVQQQLGHTSIQSTEKYLRLVPTELKKIHSQHHPRERRKETENEKTDTSAS